MTQIETVVRKVYHEGPRWALEYCEPTRELRSLLLWIANLLEVPLKADLLLSLHLSKSVPSLQTRGEIEAQRSLASTVIDPGSDPAISGRDVAFDFY